MTRPHTVAVDPAAVCAVLPLRYSADAPAMIAFLRLLGMAPAVTVAGDGFGDLVAGAGRVMIHSVGTADSGPRAGDTDLCLSVADTDEAAAALRISGLHVDVWDESYGRQGVITLPSGEAVALNERQRDLYGYQGHDASGADAGLSVTAVLSSADFAADEAWARTLGFVPDTAQGPEDSAAADTPDGAGDPWFRALRGPLGQGAVGLHRPARGDLRSRPTGSEFGEALQVRLGFETAEDLDELAARLSAAGHPAEVVEAGAVRSVHVTDPDGRRLEIHPRPAPAAS